MTAPQTPVYVLWRDECHRAAIDCPVRLGWDGLDSVVLAVLVLALLVVMVAHQHRKVRPDAP